ncbi:MAG: hypothetical protein CK425_11080 [Parachlamydia sp.]|nr:MAG: hypothetical protein CK425_11080 [Parachlamydia sp.]
MKFITLTLALLLSLLQINILVANEPVIESRQVEIIYEKLDVDPSQIFFCENEIFVLSDNNLTRVDSLKSDLGNLFAYRGYWICPRCLGKNELGNLDCAHCPYSLPY